MTMTDDPTWGLPDPDLQSEFYADVPAKRLVAWVVDVAITVAITAVIVPFTFFTALFFLPLLYLAVSFLYRWISIARHSATPGMRLTAIELRSGDGNRLDTTLAGLHTLGYTVSMAVFPLQLISVVLMLTGARKQGLSDLVLGTAAVNRAAGA